MRIDIMLVPLNLKTLQELALWVKKQKREQPYVLGIRKTSKLTKLPQFSYNGPRWNVVWGIPIYYNF